MNVDFMFESFLSNPYVKNNINKLKTSVWANLSDEEKIQVYNSINKCFCSFLKLEPYEFVYENVDYIDYIDIDDVNDDEVSNISCDKYKKIKIKDINYNQYHTLYSYFYMAISDYQRKVVNSKHSDVNEKIREKWKRDLGFFSFGSIVVKNYDDEDSNYSSVVLDAKKYCLNIMMGIVKNNFSFINSYDEEKFISYTDLIENKEVIKLGKENSKAGYNDNLKIRDKLVKINEKFKCFSKLDDLSVIKDSDIFMVIYPSVSDNIDLLLMIKLYNEVLNRIYDGDISLSNNNKKIVINDHYYSYSKFRNYGFNIILCECLKLIEKDLKNNNKFLNSNLVKDKGLRRALIEAKREWVEEVIARIDCSLMFTNFGVLKYQPLHLLFSSKNLNNYLEENTLNKKTSRR